MASPLSLTINGKAVLHHLAERAVVTITVHSEGPSQQKVSKDVTDRSNELRATLKQMALKDKNGEAAPDAPITHWTMKTLSTSSHLPTSREGTKLPREYAVNTTFSVRFSNFTELGSFASMLAAMENVSVQNISWELTDATKASLGTKSRVAAIKNANNQAKDYSEALAKGEVTAYEVIGHSEGINYAHNFASHGPGGYRGGGGGAGGEDLNFEPEHVSFSCTVTVKYKAT